MLWPFPQGQEQQTIVLLDPFLLLYYSSHPDPCPQRAREPKALAINDSLTYKTAAAACPEFGRRVEGTGVKVLPFFVLFLFFLLYKGVDNNIFCPQVLDGLEVVVRKNE